MQIKTSGIKYLGSKKKLIPFIMESVSELGDVKTAIDVFTGTTRVAQAFRQSGIHVTTSDMASYSRTFSECYIQATKEDVERANAVFGYLARRMNARKFRGWLTENYADVVSVDGGVVRFIHPKNAELADGIREEIEDFRTQVGHVSTSILVTSLIEAIDRVDNTVGIQQAYLKDWCKRSLDDLQLRMPDICIDGPVGQHLQGDVLELDYPEADVAYLDPPYSAHNFSTYYHIWESVARWDKPDVGLKTNRRVDRIGAATPRSMWNTADAVQAFRLLIPRLPVKNIMISYANDSKLIGIDEMAGMCQEFGDVTIKSVDYRRNIMSQIGNAENREIKNTDNKEFLFLIQR